MKPTIHKYIYTFNYENIERDLCLLESKYIFTKEVNNKLLFSDLEVSPSSSAFIKNRLEIISFSLNYADLIHKIKKEHIRVDEFKVEYIVFEGDTTAYAERLEKLREIGFCIEGMHEYYKPTITYAVCYHQGTWYFGVLLKNNFEWHKHKQKPHSFSNSISVNIGKSLVNIAAKANKETTLLDACCGVGTILLEARFAGFTMDGCDINEKTAKNAQINLAYFNYTAHIYHSDIKDIKGSYDAAIIDLPYNLFTSATDSAIEHIMTYTAKITDRLVIVSISDITDVIHTIGFHIVDYCSVSKRGKTAFSRKIWVCERIRKEVVTDH
ncbi:MAG: tRNA (guanine10-N2)-dimethyltransferase [Dokdonia sp.]|jgi:tRNA (guanine10-N2)-dimethyltransferase